VVAESLDGGDDLLWVGAVVVGDGAGSGFGGGEPHGGPDRTEQGPEQGGGDEFPVELVPAPAAAGDDNKGNGAISAPNRAYMRAGTFYFL
jgi:hypothetical protein